jgi:hypothetical protein
MFDLDLGTHASLGIPREICPWSWPWSWEICLWSWPWPWLWNVRPWCTLGDMSLIMTLTLGRMSLGDMSLVYGIYSPVYFDNFICDDVAVRWRSHSTQFTRDIDNIFPGGICFACCLFMFYVQKFTRNLSLWLSCCKWYKIWYFDIPYNITGISKLFPWHTSRKRYLCSCVLILKASCCGYKKVQWKASPNFGNKKFYKN